MGPIGLPSQPPTPILLSEIMSQANSNKKITINGGWFGKNKSQVSLSNIEEIRSIPRGFGSYGDMVLILNDGSKVEMKSLPLFREKQKFIEENINTSSQISNLNEVEGFATKS